LINYPIPQDKNIVALGHYVKICELAVIQLKMYLIDIEVWSLNLPDGPVIDMPLVDGKIVLAQFQQ